MTKWLQIASTTLLIVIFLLPAPHAWAQEEQDTTAIGPISLEPVVVTALRMPFTLEEVPYAVAVNGRRAIQRAQPGFGLEEALFAIPGVQVNNRYNYSLGERITIRGFGARAQFGVRGIKVYLNGIPATMPDGQTTLRHVDVSSLARAEVIRGPVSALYGNAAGGVIRLTTEAPPPAPLGQQLRVVAGENGLLRLQSTTGGRSGRSSYVLNLTRFTYEGYRAFSATENVYVNARYGYRGARSEWHLTASFVNYDAQNPGALSDSLLQVDRTQAYQNNRLQKTGEKGLQGQIGVRWQREVGLGTLEVSGYTLTRRIENPIPPAIIDLKRLAGGLRVLYRSQRPGSGASELQWAVGVSGDLQRDDRQNFTNERGERGALVLDQLGRVWNFAVFAQGSAEIIPRLRLLGGLRYDYFLFGADDRLISRTNPDDSGSRLMDALSPSIGLTYGLWDGLNLYSNVSTAFETPTTTELVNRPSGAGGFNPHLQPQRTLSFEVGAKGQVGSHVTYQLALYHANVKNALIPFEVASAPGRQFFRNTGSAVHRGAEVGIHWMPVGGLSTRLAYTYVDARFKEYAVGGAVYDGNQMPGIAPHHLEARLSYMSRRGWFGALDARYQSKVPVNDENTASSPAYALVDLRMGIEDVPLGGLRLTTFIGVNNLFNTRYNTAVVVNGYGGRYYVPGPGRAFYGGVKLGLGWGE